MVRAVAYFLRTTSSQTSFATTHSPSPPMLLYCGNVHSESFLKYDSGFFFLVNVKDVCKEVVCKKYATSQTMWLLQRLTQGLKIEK